MCRDSKESQGNYRKRTRIVGNRFSGEGYKEIPIEDSLYYVKLRSDVGIFYKIGVTSFRRIEDRIYYKRRNADSEDKDRAPVEIDSTLYFQKLDNAYEIEQKLHMLLGKVAVFDKKKPIVTCPMFRDGQSELYTEDVLSLDPDYSEEMEAQTRAEVNSRKKSASSDSEIFVFLCNLPRIIVESLILMLVLCRILIRNYQDKPLMKSKLKEGFFGGIGDMRPFIRRVEHDYFKDLEADVRIEIDKTVKSFNRLSN